VHSIISKTGGIYSREHAILHAIYRSIISAPEPLPNIEFAFNVDDVVGDPAPIWALARRAEDEHLWLMPDFGYFSWPETKVGTWNEVQRKIVSDEESALCDWTSKVHKLFWRGATLGLSVRERLLAVTQQQTAWADVKTLNWRDPESMANDLKTMPEHCQYKYLMHTEGVSYSGRLKYLQSCRSVIIAHPLEWIQHHHHLMQHAGPRQNYVLVQRDLEDLEIKVLQLQGNDEEARRIADNNVKTFREHYLTQSAEACYWRKLMHGWASVSHEPRFYEEKNGTKVWRGLPIESFFLERKMEWDPY
jgi:hypothetical protein